MKKKVIKNEGKHDSKTCFRCRLHELWAELKDTNEVDFMLMAMAEASGSMLSQLDDDYKAMFMSIVMKVCHEDEQDDLNKARFSTKH